MKTTFLKSIGGTALALLVLVGGMQISVSGQSDEGHEPSLVGVWVTQVTRRNCETGAPIGATSQIQVTFAKGGTLLETVGPSIFRSPGNGIWKREHGWNEYSFGERFMRFDAAGSFTGSGVVRAALTLDETGDHYTSTATNDVLDAAGNVIGNDSFFYEDSSGNGALEWHGYQFDPCTGLGPPGFSDSVPRYALVTKGDQTYLKP